MQIEVFKFQNNPVRTKIINGKEWFCAGDVCKILDIQNGRDVVAKLEIYDVEKSDIIDRLNRKQQVSFVNEAGLYEIIFKSTKPEAKLFKRWIFEEVLPQIRKTGTYAVQKLPTMKELAYQIIRIEEEKERLQIENQKQEEVINEQIKQITYYDDMLVAEGTFCLQDGGKILHLKPNNFIAKLKVLGYLCTKGEYTRATQKYIDSGYFVMKTIKYNNSKKSAIEKPQVMITAKGIAFIAKKVLTDFSDVLNKPSTKAMYKTIRKNHKTDDVLNILKNN